MLTCSAGFYVRTFAHELGRLVGTGACLEALRRTRSGQFKLVEALSIEALRDGVAEIDVIPLERLLPAFPTVAVTDEGLARVTHGGHWGPSTTRRVRKTRPTGVGRVLSDPPHWTRIFDSGGHLIALGTRQVLPASLHPAIVLT